MSFMGNVIGNKALAAHGKNEYEKALQLYNEAYEKGMDKPRLLRGYSVLLIRMGRLDRAAPEKRNHVQHYRLSEGGTGRCGGGARL